MMPIFCRFPVARRLMLSSMAGISRGPLRAPPPAEEFSRLGVTRTLHDNCANLEAAVEANMPETKTLKRARKARRRGKSPSSQAGEFVREEIHHVREGKHGARSTKQAIAIGLSKARRAGVKLASPKRAKASTRRARERRRSRAGRSRRAGAHARCSALKREPHGTASRDALARQAKKLRAQAWADRAPPRRCEGRAHEGRRGAQGGRAQGGAYASAAARVARADYRERAHDQHRELQGGPGTIR